MNFGAKVFEDSDVCRAELDRCLFMPLVGVGFNGVKEPFRACPDAYVCTGDVNVTDFGRPDTLGAASGGAGEGEGELREKGLCLLDGLLNEGCIVAGGQ